MLPEEKYLSKNDNPPEFSVEFFQNQKNLSAINCFSDEGNKWEKSETFLNKNILKIKQLTTFQSLNITLLISI